MKTLKMLNRNTLGMISAAALLASFTLPASAASFDPSLESDLVRICEAIKSDSKLKLNRTLKQTNLSYRAVSNGLVCNGMSVHDFARQHQATKTGELLAKRTGNSDTMLTANKAY